MSNPMYYIQYGIGFTDQIMGAIQAAMYKAATRTTPINYGNIIKSFIVQNDTHYTANLNLAEISNNPDLDSLSLTLSIAKNNAGKNYLSDIGFSAYMPLASIFQLTISSTDTKLIDFGKTLDMSNVHDYVNNYKYANSAFWEASNGEWTLAKETLYKLTFEENGAPAVNDISAPADTIITLPTLTTMVSDNGSSKTIKHFLGWYTSPTFEEKTKFNSDKMPNRDTTLYAKWSNDVLKYTSITFVTYCDKTFQNIRKLEGTPVALPILNIKTETEGNITKTYAWKGWFTDENFTNKFETDTMPSQDTTLYAKWELTKIEETRAVNIYDNNSLIYTKRVKLGEQINLARVDKINETTKFYLDKDYQNEYTGNFIMEEDLSLHIRNKYTLTVLSDYGNSGKFEYSLYQGETVSLPAQGSYIEDDGTQTSNTTYTFSGYSENLTVMPNENKTITANWTVDKKLYYTVSFDLRWYLVFDCTAGSAIHTPPTPIASFKVLEGTTLDLTQYAPTCKAYLTAIPIDPKNFKATSWGTSPWANYTHGGSGFTSITITKNTTLYACWARA